jgi:REP-associated tyrosine transposase
LVIIFEGMRPTPIRRHPRRRSHDYTQPSAYFVTTITYARKSLLGSVGRYGVRLTPFGEIVRKYLLAVPKQFPGTTIDTFVVMPDHVHAIIILSVFADRRSALSQVVGWVKQRASRDIHLSGYAADTPVWQRSFHDRIIRDATAFNHARRYVSANPARAFNDLNR